MKDRGLGDTLARIFKRFGIKQKRGCGCRKRQSRLNTLIPYSKTAWRWRLLWPLLWWRRGRD